MIPRREALRVPLIHVSTFDLHHSQICNSACTHRTLCFQLWCVHSARACGVCAHAGVHMCACGAVLTDVCARVLCHCASACVCTRACSRGCACVHACVCIHMGVRFLCATSVWVGAIVCHQGSARLDPTTDGSRLGGSVGRARRNLGVMEHTHIRHEFSHFRLESWFRHACVNKSADTACTWSNFEGCVRYGPPVQAQLP